MLALLLGMVFEHAGMAADGHSACPEGRCATEMHGNPGCCGVGHCAVTLTVAGEGLLQPPCPAGAGPRLTTPVHYGLQFGIERPPKRA